jgi:hypothetical protein
MSKTRFTLNLLASLVISLACFSLANAQATRTWVSGVGDDANPCSRTAPCKTFAGAISKTAAQGEINAIDPGGFGAVTITKAITIDGGGTFASILAAGTNGVIINANASTDRVILRNISINGAGTGINGIRYLAANTVIVENVTIDRFTGQGIDANLTAAGNLFVKNVSISNCGTTSLVDAGIKMTTTTGTLRALITDSSFTKNVVGVHAQERVDVTVRNSTAMGDQSVGTPIGYQITTNTTTTMSLENCVASNLQTGLRVVETAGTAKAFVSNTMFANCSNAGTSASGTAEVISSINNKFTNNTTDQAGPFTTKAQQ